ncbi:putative tRNA pseudouridine synthase Pus10 [Rhagoletis pomonella]|uniref:putative tRNA pseudouridine synthase Pus10 n=1 Tax=Rhagoletis pomonella TaxID=28610 RepID=UPI00178742A9|nr:putative tRNA pseudouridine synthase Pus10 [Rhagoletis pomonella]
MKNQDLVNYLRECGVCLFCQLRYLKARGNEYQNRRQYLEKVNVEYKDETESSSDPAHKKKRQNVCPTCLDLFSKRFKDQLVQAILDTDIAKYECDGIVVAISIPIVLQLRQLSMWYALLDKFEKNFHQDRAPDVSLKEAIKLILHPTICENLKKKYDIDNGLMININLCHELENEEIARLEKLNNVAYPPKTGHKLEPISRSLIEKKYTPLRVSSELFKKTFSVPPSIPNESLKLDSISLVGPTAYVAGRYRKVSRKLSHTPWVLNGKRVMDDSIEEIIIRYIATYFCEDRTKINFMSSGREDVDVRCLGTGRPFVLEISNAFRTSLPPEQARQMEEYIDASQKVSVRNLQVVSRDDLSHIKMGEEQKRKCYRALCQLDGFATADILEKLNLPKGFEIQQKTPIRVLHRRPLHTRPRAVYSLKASVYAQNKRLLILDVVTQAGTYIKELVHGEFGRTTPSVSSLIGQPVDIVALDVMEIDLDWPPAVTF